MLLFHDCLALFFLQKVKIKELFGGVITNNVVSLVSILTAALSVLLQPLQKYVIHSCSPTAPPPTPILHLPPPFFAIRKMCPTQLSVQFSVVAPCFPPPKVFLPL